MEAARTIAVNPSHMPVMLRVCRDPAKSLGQRWPLPPVGRAHRLSLGSPGSWRLEESTQLRLRRSARAEGKGRLAGGNTRKLALNDPPRSTQQRTTVCTVPDQRRVFCGDDLPGMGWFLGLGFATAASSQCTSKLVPHLPAPLQSILPSTRDGGRQAPAIHLRVSTGRGISPVLGLQFSPLWRGW
jgi:hypothetical protein